MTLVTVDPASGMEEGGTEKSENEGRKKGGAKEVSKDGENELTNDGMTNSDQEQTKKRRKKKQILEIGPSGSVDIPMVTVEHATPSPHPPARLPDENNNDEDMGEDDDDFDDSDDDGEEEEVEEEEVDTEMTPEEKLKMYEAVKTGDIDSLEDCLDKPNANIKMIWFKENLLMAAIRHGHQEMAEFLLDNGVDHTYSTSVVALKETSKGKRFDRYEITCRQMAYDQDMLDIVELIDLLQGKLWPFIRPPDRVPRLKREKPPTPSESDDSSSSSSSSSDDDDDEDDYDGGRRGSESDTEGSGDESIRKTRRRKKTKRREKKKVDAEAAVAQGGGDKENGDDTTLTVAASSMIDAESGHHGEENEGEILKKKDKKKKKKEKRKKKKEKKQEEGEDGLDGTEGEKDKTGTGSVLDVDSGHHSMASSKLKIANLREHDRLSELEEQSGLLTERPALSSEGGLFPPRDRHEDKSPRSRDHTFTHSERSEAEGSHIPDEGYGTISLKSQTPCVSPEMKPSWSLPPTNRIRSNKAAISVWQANKNRLGPSPEYQSHTRDRPLRWRKVSTVGSYAKESRQWHVKGNSDNAEDEASVEISEINLKFSSPTSAASSSSISSSMISSSLSSSLPKSILKPGTASSSASSMTEKPQSPALQSKNSQGKAGVTSEKVAGYMRPTKSTMTKKRLSPNFVTSYGALDFQYIHVIPETKLSQNFLSAAPTSTASFDKREMYSPSNLSMKSYGITNQARSNSVQKRNHSSISFRS